VDAGCTQAGRQGLGDLGPNILGSRVLWSRAPRRESTRAGWWKGEFGRESHLPRLPPRDRAMAPGASPTSNAVAGAGRRPWLGRTRAAIDSVACGPRDSCDGFAGARRLVSRNIVRRGRAGRASPPTRNLGSGVFRRDSSAPKRARGAGRRPRRGRDEPKPSPLAAVPACAA